MKLGMINNKNADLDKLNVILHVTKKMQDPNLIFLIPPALKKTKKKPPLSGTAGCTEPWRGAIIKRNNQNSYQVDSRTCYAT